MHGPTYVVKVHELNTHITHTNTYTNECNITGKPNKAGGFDQCAFLIVILMLLFVATYHWGNWVNKT